LALELFLSIGAFGFGKLVFDFPVGRLQARFLSFAL